MEEVLLGYASFFSLTCYSLETGRTQDCFLGAIECFLCFECCKGCCECFADILCTLPHPRYRLSGSHALQAARAR